MNLPGNPQAHSFPLASTSPLHKSIRAPDEEKNELQKHKGHCKPDLSSDGSVKAQEGRQRYRGSRLGLDRARLWGLLSAERTDLDGRDKPRITQKPNPVGLGKEGSGHRSAERLELQGRQNFSLTLLLSGQS